MAAMTGIPVIPVQPSTQYLCLFATLAWACVIKMKSESLTFMLLATLA